MPGSTLSPLVSIGSFPAVRPLRETASILIDPATSAALLLPLGQPSLSTAIMLHLSVALSGAYLAQSEVELFHVLVILQLLRRPVQYSPAVLHDIRIFRDFQGRSDVLLD